MSKFLRKNSKLVNALVDNVVGYNFINYLCKYRKDAFLETEHRIDIHGIGDGNITYRSEKIMNDLMGFLQVLNNREIYSSVWDETDKFGSMRIYRYSVNCSWDGYVKQASFILNQPLENLFEDFTKNFSK